MREMAATDKVVPNKNHLNLGTDDESMDGEIDQLFAILKYLTTKGHHMAAATLEKDASVTLSNAHYIALYGAPEIVFIRDLIVEGMWDHVLTYLEPIAKALPAHQSKQLNYLVLRAKLAELLTPPQFEQPDARLSSQQPNRTSERRGKVIDQIAQCMRDLRECGGEGDSVEDIRQIAVEIGSVGGYDRTASRSRTMTSVIAILVDVIPNPPTRSNMSTPSLSTPHTSTSSSSSPRTNHVIADDTTHGRATVNSAISNVTGRFSAVVNTHTTMMPNTDHIIAPPRQASPSPPPPHAVVVPPPPPPQATTRSHVREPQLITPTPTPSLSRKETTPSTPKMMPSVNVADRDSKLRTARNSLSYAYAIHNTTNSNLNNNDNNNHNSSNTNNNNNNNNNNETNNNNITNSSSSNGNNDAATTTTIINNIINNNENDNTDINTDDNNTDLNSINDTTTTTTNDNNNSNTNNNDNTNTYNNDNTNNNNNGYNNTNIHNTTNDNSNDNSNTANNDSTNTYNNDNTNNNNNGYNNNSNNNNTSIHNSNNNNNNNTTNNNTTTITHDSSLLPSSRPHSSHSNRSHHKSHSQSHRPPQQQQQQQQQQHHHQQQQQHSHQQQQQQQHQHHQHQQQHQQHHQQHQHHRGMRSRHTSHTSSNTSSAPQPQLTSRKSPTATTTPTATATAARLSGFGQKRSFQNVAVINDPQAIRALDFSPSGRFLAVGSNSSVLRVCVVSSLSTIKTSQPIPRLPITWQQRGHHTGSIYCLKWNNTGSLIATGSNDKSVRLQQFDAAKCEGGACTELRPHCGTIRDLAFLCGAGGSEVIACGGGGDNSIALYDCFTASKMGNLRGHLGQISSLTSWDAGRVLFSGSADRTVKMWDMRARDCQKAYGPFPSAVTAIATMRNDKAHSSSQLFAAGLQTGEIHVHNIASGNPQRVVLGHTGEIKSLQFSQAHNVQWLLSGSYDGAVNLANLTEAQTNGNEDIIATNVASHDDKVLCTRFFPWQRLSHSFAFASSGADQTARIWSATASL